VIEEIVKTVKKSIIGRLAEGITFILKRVEE